MRQINKVIIHCSDTYPDMDIGRDEIERWHLDRGWAGIGYNYIIRRNGIVEKGRDLDNDGDVDEEIGAHALGHNANSIGICVVGGKAKGPTHPVNFTRHQWQSLEVLCERLVKDYPNAEVIGHSDVSKKPCPMFNVKEWWGK